MSLTELEVGMKPEYRGLGPHSDKPVYQALSSLGHRKIACELGLVSANKQFDAIDGNATGAISPVGSNESFWQKTGASLFENCEPNSLHDWSPLL